VSKTAVGVTGIKISPKTLVLAVGATETLLFEITPSNATNVNVTWLSTNTGIAEVVEGGVLGVSEGETTIQVISEDGSFTDEAVITVVVPENESPVAIISATPTSGVLPLEVQFDASGSSDDKEITDYLWDFGDGNTAKGFG